MYMDVNELAAWIETERTCGSREPGLGSPSWQSWWDCVFMEGLGTKHSDGPWAVWEERRKKSMTNGPCDIWEGNKKTTEGQRAREAFCSPTRWPTRCLFLNNKGALRPKGLRFNRTVKDEIKVCGLLGESSDLLLLSRLKGKVKSSDLAGVLGYESYVTMFPGPLKVKIKLMATEGLRTTQRPPVLICLSASAWIPLANEYITDCWHFGCLCPRLWPSSEDYALHSWESEP